MAGLNFDSDNFLLDSVTWSCTVGSCDNGGSGAGVKHCSEQNRAAK